MAQSEMTADKAYRKGWNASKTTKTYDLDAACARFVQKFGQEHERSFDEGWCDYAADRPYGWTPNGCVEEIEDEENEA